MKYDSAWEDSLTVIDLRDLLHIEIIERSVSERLMLDMQCRLSKCRRHGKCSGPMVPPPGKGLPPSWFQLGERGLRPPCRHGQVVVPVKSVLDHGPVFQKVLEMRDPKAAENLLANRIRARRQERAAARRAGMAKAANEKPGLAGRVR